jgi:hypothetical protein
MKKEHLVILVLLVAALQFGMARRSDQYDEDARQQEKVQKQMAKETAVPEDRHPVKNFATGIKEMTIDNTKDTLEDTTKGTVSEKPIVGTLDGVQKSSEKVVDNTIKGIKKVVSLGYAKDDSYEIDPPKKGSGDAAKIKLFQF